MEIQRDLYLRKPISKAGNGKIKVVAGLRRSGKSYLLNHIYEDYLIASGVREPSILSFSLDKKKDAIADFIKSMTSGRKKIEGQ